MAHFTTWGMTGTIVTEHPKDESAALEFLYEWIGRIDASCNRFRHDSEISLINASSGGGTFAISPTLECAIQAALASSALTGGLCDPTVLGSLEALGYDRDIDDVHDGGREGALAACPGVDALDLDTSAHTLTVAPGVRLDLGASAKALLADVVANELVDRGGALVEIGGDVALHGVGPHGPWVIGVAETLEITGNEPRVTMDHGGLATSSRRARQWRTRERTVNHIIDPRSGDCASGDVVVATVAAGSCRDANAFATAALLWDDDAAWHIAQAGHNARLIHTDGSIELVGGWPREERTA